MNKIIIKYFENLKNSFEKVSISFNEIILCNNKQHNINNKIQFDNILIDKESNTKADKFINKFNIVKCWYNY